MLVKSDAEFAKVLDGLRTVLGAYVNAEVVADPSQPLRPADNDATESKGVKHR